MIIIIKLNFSFDQLVSEMISENLKIARKEELIKNGDFEKMYR